MKKIERKKNKSKYITDYIKEKYIRFEFRLRKHEDEKLINYLQNKKNKNQYLKDLLQNDMTKETK